MKIDESKMKTHLFNLKDYISTIGFLNIFELACGTHRTHGKAAVWVYPGQMNKTIANTLIRPIFAADNSSLLPSQFAVFYHQYRKRLRLYPGVVFYMPLKVSTDQTYTNFDAVIQQYTQRANMMTQQYGDNSVA